MIALVFKRIDGIGREVNSDHRRLRVNSEPVLPQKNPIFNRSQYIFWPAATEAYVGLGRGAIIVNTTARPTGEGHPFGYFPQSFIEQYEYADIKRMVRDYDPDNELVVVVLKPEDHISTYRVQPQPRQC